MTALFFVAYLLSRDFGLAPAAQTPSKPKTSVTASNKPHPRGSYRVSPKEHPTSAHLLLGAWSAYSDCNGDFLLKGNTQVLFYDPGTDGKPEVVYWEVANNKLSFLYTDGDVVTDAIMKVTTDSLVLYRRDKAAGVIGYSRFVRLLSG